MLTRDLLAKVRKIEIRTRRAVDELTAGAYHSVFKGKGIEFDEVREYVLGDDIRSIDWNVTARMNAPYVKQFVEERELSIGLLVDVSGSGDVGSRDRTKNELATELAAVLAFSAIRNGDRVGLTLFTTREELHLPARKGRRHGLRLIRELVACERTQMGTDIGSALETCLRTSPRRRVVFVISDFLDSGFEHALKVAAKRHDVIAIRVSDLSERTMPRVGLIHTSDAETGSTSWVPAWSGKTRRAYAEQNRKLLESTKAAIRRSGAELIDIQTDQDYLVPLMQFFRSRQVRAAHHVSKA